ncbi:MAG TPA: YraN family protein, partial [Actinobacteria bacterium]|nr:YraN family protein [Actinomycetota bacterium]
NRHGEIDVIAIKKGLLVFCEVKTRRNLKYGKPFEAITEEKQKRIRRLAEGFIANKKIDFHSIRFDAVSILVGNKLEISHIKDAF